MFTLGTLLWCHCTDCWERMEVIDPDIPGPDVREVIYKCPSCNNQITMAWTIIETI
jgi:hypothetical protein